MSNETIEAPLTKWILRFHKKTSLEEKYRISSRVTSRKLMTKCYILAGIIATMAFSIDLIIFYVSGMDYDPNSESTIEERKTAWGITRLPIFILGMGFDWLFSKITLLSKMRGTVFTICTLCLMAECTTFLYGTAECVLFGYFAIGSFIIILWLGYYVFADWIIYSLTLFIGYIPMLFILFSLHDNMKLLDCFQCSLMGMLLILLTRRSEAQKRTEFYVLDCLKKREEELEMMISKLPVGIAILESEDFQAPENRVKYVNTTLKNILKETEGEDVINFVTSEIENEHLNIPQTESRRKIDDRQDSKNLENFISKIHSKGGIELNISKEMVYEAKTGSKKELKVQATKIKFQKKECIGLIMEDLTLIKKQERDRLTNEFQNRLVRSISHEIRTPINAIQGSMEIVENSIKKKTNKYAIYFKTIKCGIGCLLYFVEGVLKLSKSLSGGRIELNYKKFNIIDTVEDIIFLLNNEIDTRRNVKIITDTEKLKFKEIFNDQEIISQLIFILTANSVKYTKEGLIEVIVEEDKMQNNLVVIVKDSGIGIKKEQQKHLFQLYGDNNLDSEFGIGMGLTLCSHLVKSMGGDINLESEEHVGTTVTITFPCQFEVEDEDVVSPTNTMYSIPTEQHQGYIYQTNYKTKCPPNLDPPVCNKSFRSSPIMSPMSPMSSLPLTPHIQVRNTNTHCNCPQILIVDDVPSNIFILDGLLNLLGLKSDSASNGFEAIRQVTATALNRKCCGNYQLVLMDCNMPVMDGYDACRNIRNLIQKKTVNNCLIVAVTAYNSEENKLLCYEAQMDSVLFKPVSKLQLEKLFEEFSLFQSIIDKSKPVNKNMI